MRFKWIPLVAGALTLLVSVPAVAQAAASTTMSGSAYTSKSSTAYSANRSTRGTPAYRPLPYTTNDRIPAYSRPASENTVCIALYGYRCPSAQKPPVQPIIRPVPAKGGQYWVEPDYPVVRKPRRPITIQPIPPVRPEPKQAPSLLSRLFGKKAQNFKPPVVRPVDR